MTNDQTEFTATALKTLAALGDWQIPDDYAQKLAALYPMILEDTRALRRMNVDSATTPSVIFHAD